MRLSMLAAAVFLSSLSAPAALAQDQDAYIAAQQRRAATYPLGKQVYKEGKKKKREAMKVWRKEGWAAYLEVLEEQRKEESSN